MDNISIQMVLNMVIFLASFIGAVASIMVYIKKGFSKWIDGAIKPVRSTLDDVSKKISSVEMNNCKNYIVNFLSKVEAGDEVTDDALQRYYENYDLYISMGGNSYIHDWANRLTNEGKLSHSHMKHHRHN